MAFEDKSDTSLAAFPIEQFPDEILSLILSSIRVISIKDFPSVLRVSRKWYGIGEDLIWRNVVLTRDNLPHFVLSIQKWQHRSGLSQRVQSLTICIGPSKRSHPDLLRKGIDQLAQCLPAMSSLKTFSFYNQPDASDPWASSDLRNDFTESLVRSLPDSVQNLEIHSPSIHFWKGSSALQDENCLCHVIAARIDGLRCLRLAYPRICSKLLQRASSTLEYLSINATKPDLEPCIRECHFADANARLSWDGVQAQKSTASKSTIRDLLGKLKDDAFIKERLPRIRRLTIVEPYHFKQYSSQQWFLLNVHGLSRDLDDITGTPEVFTNSHPIWPTGLVRSDGRDPYQFILRRCLHSNSSVDPSHECSSSDIVGYSIGICNALEGTNAWITDSTSSRQPCYLLPPTTNPTLADSRFLSKQQWEKHYETYRSQRLSEIIDSVDFRHHADDQKCDNWFDIQGFREYFGVKPKEAGADCVWYLEEKLRHSALWGRTFKGGFPHSTEDFDQSEVCSSVEALREMQSDLDLPYDAGNYD